MIHLVLSIFRSEIRCYGHQKKMLKKYFEEQKNSDSTPLHFWLFVLAYLPLTISGILANNEMTESIWYYSSAFIAAILFGTSGLITMIRKPRMAYRGRVVTDGGVEVYGFALMSAGYLMAFGNLIKGISSLF